MSKWRDEFLKTTGSKPVKDLQQETKIKRAEYDLADILAKDIQKMRNSQAMKDINKIIRGEGWN